MKLINQEYRKQKETIRKYLKLYTPDREYLKLAKERQIRYFRHEKVDRVPIAIFSSYLTPDQQSLPNPDFYDAFYSPSLMLAQQLRNVITTANSKSDAVPSFRVNTGTGTALAAIGLEQDIFHDKMPWLQRHMTKDEISNLTPDDIQIRGTLERVLDYTVLFRECIDEAGLGDVLPIHVADQQGPFDIAHLMYGDAIFIEMYDDPAFVHHMMEIALSIGERMTLWCKEASGEPLTVCHHFGMICADNFGLRICEDTTVLVSEEMMLEFALPYTRRLATRFGGALVHYCGRNDTLTRELCSIPEIKAINFGLIPGKEQDHIFEEDMKICLESNTVSLMNWPKRPDENGEQYLRRIFKYASKGAVLFHLWNVGPETGFKDATELLAFWEKLDLEKTKKRHQ